MTTKRAPKQPAKRKVGRPAHAPTDATRLRVQRLVHAKHTDEEIALCIGINDATLRLHYGKELKYGRMTLRAEILDLLWTAAKEKNQIGAIKTLHELSAIEAPTYKAPELPAAAEHEEPAAPRLGKKEQKMLDAQNPDTSTDMGRLIAERRANARTGVKPH